jgi:hypothetical protein
MTAVRSNALRIVLAVDAAACALSGAGLALDAGLIAGPLGMPAAVLQPLGEGLVAYALLLAWLASRASLPRAVVWTLVALNIAWGVESVMLPVLGWARPTGVGLTLLLVQAAGALLVADLQFLALRRSREPSLP